MSGIIKKLKMPSNPTHPKKIKEEERMFKITRYIEMETWLLISGMQT